MTFTKTHLYIAIAVLVFMALFGYYYYRKGKNTVSIQALPNDLPGNQGAASGSGGASNDEIKRVVNALYNDMNGWNITGHNYEPYQTALTFSDTDIVKLYNAFNTLYQQDSKQTLAQWIESEEYVYYDIPDALLARFAKLNLK